MKSQFSANIDILLFKMTIHPCFEATASIQPNYFPLQLYIEVNFRILVGAFMTCVVKVQL